MHYSVEFSAGSSSIIKHRSKQPLSNWLWPARITDALDEACCQSAAGTRSTDRHETGIDSERRRELLQPVPRCEAVVRWNGKGMFRRKPIVHRDDHDAERSADVAASEIVGAG